jgi:hypothetical protein
VFFSKNAPNLPFLAQEAQMIFFHFFALLTVGSCIRLLGKHVQKVSRHLTARIVRLQQMKLKENFFSTVSGRESGTADFGRPWGLGFCTIVMHIKLGTCVPNLRGR